MDGPGHDASFVLPDGRTLEYWEGGDPDGRGVVFHPGSPCGRMFGRLGHEAAVLAGVRLVAVNRPGYGGSTSIIGVPSLIAAGHDTAALTASLGLDEYAVLGVSGGAPVAVATAVADPTAVRAVGIVGGVGPWRQLYDPSGERANELACLKLLDAGDVAGARAGLARLADEENVGLLELDDEGRVEAYLGPVPDPLTESDRLRRAVWAANLALVLPQWDGYVYDSLLQGGRWDIDLRDVVAATRLWYGADDDVCPPAHGQWYADRIQDSEMTAFAGEGHIKVCSSHWTEELTALSAAWN